MKFTRNQIVIVGAALLVILGGYFWYRASRKNSNQLPPVVLKVWGVEPKDVWDKIFGYYTAKFPNVSFEYSQIDEGRYDRRVVEALASGEGPDVFEIDNHSVYRRRNILYPADSQYISSSALEQSFPSAVSEDTVQDGKIYALPLYFDTLSLISNKNHLDQAGIVFAPKTWTEFLADVNLLKQVSESSQISRAGAAMGTANNISNSADILQALMIQNGSRIWDPSAGVTLATESADSAFNFYTQFANAASPYYTWNQNQPAALDAFSNSAVSMIIGYKSDYDAVLAKSPFLKVLLGALPQTAESGAVNFPSYRALSVSKVSPVWGWGWSFAAFITRDSDAMKGYMEATGHPPALLSLINSKKDDPVYGIYARGALVAKSWPQPDDAEVKKILNEAVASVLSGRETPARALSAAQQQINLLYK